MRLLDTEQHQYTARIDALIRARITDHAEQIAYEALQSRAVALPHTLVAHTLLAAAHAGVIDDQAFHAAAAIELIRAGAAMHRRLFSHTHQSSASHHERSPLHGPTLMLGDYFFAMAASEMAETPNARIIAEYSTCVMELAEAFLQGVALDHPDIVAQVLAHNDAVEGRIMRSALIAGFECARIPVSTLPITTLSTLLTRLISLHVHLQQVADPFDSLDRGTVILPIAYALEHDRDATMAAIARHDGDELNQLLKACDGIAQTQALIEQTRRILLDTLDGIRYDGARERFHFLITRITTATATTTSTP